MFDNSVTESDSRGAFAYLDKDRSGELTLAEFFDGLIEFARDKESKIGKITARLLNKLFASGGKGQENEALKQIGQVFEQADSNKDGKMDLTEFKRAMEVFGVDVEDEGVEKVFREMDDSGDGTVSMEEFADALISYVVEGDAGAESGVVKAIKNIIISSITSAAGRAADKAQEEAEMLASQATDSLGPGTIKGKPNSRVMREMKLRLKDEWNQKREQVAKSGKKFEDNEFPARPNWRELNATKWMFDKKKYAPKIYEGKPKPEDVAQGELGDCYYLSSLCLVAGKPSAMKTLLIADEVNDEGIYLVAICKDGDWDFIYLDDTFPTTRSGRLRNAQAQQNQLWVALMEKAWAKLNGSYENCVAGKIGDALQDLTGAPIEMINTFDVDFDKNLAFSKLLHFNKCGYLVGAGCGNTLKEAKQFEQMGLIRDHAYSLMDVAIYKGNRLLKLRNPWGEGEWKGAWSDKWPGWTPEAKSALGLEDIDDGSFWMHWDDVLRFFRDFSVCKYVSSWNYLPMVNYMQETELVSETSYLVKVSKPSVGFISLVQEHKRGKDKDYKYVDLGAFVVKCDPKDPKNFDAYSYIGAVWPSVERSGSAEINFDDKDATYLIIPFGVHSGSRRKFVVSLYTANPIIIKEIPSDPYTLAPAAHCALEVCKNDAKTRPLFKEIPIYFNTLSAGHSIWIWIENNDDKRSLQFQFSIQGTQLMTSGRAKVDTTLDVIWPKSQQIVNCLVADDIQRGYQYKCRFGFGVRTDRKDLHQPAIEKDDLFQLIEIKEGRAW